MMCSRDAPPGIMREDLLGNLPLPLLETVLSRLVADKGVGHLRATCKQLKAVCDSLTTRLSLGGPPHPLCSSTCLLEPAPGVRQCLLSLTKIAERVTELEIRPQLQWLVWSDILQTGGTLFCERLLRLCLRGCHNVDNLVPVAACTSLMRLDLSDCYKLTDLSALHPCTKLLHLQLNNCHGLTSLCSLEACALPLKQLELNGCHNIFDLKPLGRLITLTHLGLAECSGISDIEPLSCLSALVHLTLRDCSFVEDLSALALCQNLADLNLNHCRGITNLHPLAACPLTRLDCGLCPGIHNLAPVALPTMEFLDMGNTRVEDLAPLAACHNLRHLQINGCMCIVDLSPLSGCSYLRHVDIRACHKIKDLSPLAHVRRVLKQEPVPNLPSSSSSNSWATRKECSASELVDARHDRRGRHLDRLSGLDVLLARKRSAQDRGLKEVSRRRTHPPPPISSDSSECDF